MPGGGPRNRGGGGPPIPGGGPAIGGIPNGGIPGIMPGGRGGNAISIRFTDFSLSLLRVLGESLVLFY